MPGDYYGLTGNIAPEEREIEHHKGNFMSFRPLSGKQVKKARSASLRETMDEIGPDTLAFFRSASSDSPEIKEAERIAAAESADPLAGYSDTVLLRHGLVSWRGPAYEGVACDDERKDELDDMTRRWAALQVLSISRISEGEAESSEPGSGRNGAEHQRTSAASGSPS